MKLRLAAGLLFFGAAAAIANPAHGAPVEQINMKSVFNEDVIVNGTTRANIDTSQETVDAAETSLVTQGAAKAVKECKSDPDGLPNDGRFKKTDDHPAVDLAYSNTKNGKNARRSPIGDSYEVAVPGGKYKAIHVFATSGQGDATMEVELVYNDAPEEDVFDIPDWFDSFPPSTVYTLSGKRDRAHPTGKPCFDDDGASLWGIEVKADKSRRLEGVSITRPDSDGSAVLNVFGMTGVRAK